MPYKPPYNKLCSRTKRFKCSKVHVIESTVTIRGNMYRVPSLGQQLNYRNNRNTSTKPSNTREYSFPLMSTIHINQFMTVDMHIFINEFMATTSAMTHAQNPSY